MQRSVDREVRQKYVIAVSACDLGSPDQVRRFKVTRIDLEGLATALKHLQKLHPLSLLFISSTSPKNYTQKCASHYLTIHVKDVNDNPPVFQQSSYVVTNISEATKIGATILQVSATDADQVLPPF